MHTKCLNIIMISFFIFSQVFFLSCDRDVFTGEPSQDEDLSSAIFISSQPNGASIFVDGRMTGFITPDTIKYLSPGDHDIILKKKLYLDTLIRISVERNHTSFLNVNMNANAANFTKLIITSEPSGADIILNDSSTNHVTPDSIENIVPGIYEVKCRLINHRDNIQNVTLEAGRKRILHFELKDTTFWIDYNSSTVGLPGDSYTDAVIYNNTLWFSSSTNGLVQYNGTDWINYPISEYNLVSNTINKLYLDNDGNLWLCLNGTLIRFNNGYKEFIRHEYIVQDFNDMLIDENGVMWLATRSGLIKYNGTDWIKYSEDNTGIDISYANALYQDEDGKLYIGTTSHYHPSRGSVSGLVATYFQDKFEILVQPSPIYSSSYKKFVKKDENNIWIGYDEGLWRKNPRIGYINSSNTLTLLSLDNITNYDVGGISLNDIYGANDGIWIVLENALIKLNNNSQSVLFNYRNSILPVIGLRTVIRDNKGKMWLTTINDGIFKYKQ